MDRNKKLGRIPGDEPQGRVVAAGEVDTGNLQVAAVDVALMERHIAIHHDPLDSAAAHGIVLAIIASAICMREHHAIHRHGLGCDGAGGYRTVLHSFRMLTILRPLHRSQAAFANKNRFTLDCGRKLRNELLLHACQRLSSSIVTRLGSNTVHTSGRRFYRVCYLGNRGILRCGILD